MQLEKTKRVESQCVRDVERILLRNKSHIRDRWVRFFRLLLNTKFDLLDPDISKRLPQQPVASTLRIEPTAEETTTVIMAMTNAEAVGKDSLSAQLLKIVLQQDWKTLLELQRLTTLIWREAKVPQQ